MEAKLGKMKGGRRQRYDEATKWQAVELRRSGLSYQEIGERLGVATKTAWAWVHILTVPGFYEAFRERENGHMQDYYWKKKHAKR